jgi:hypothetical protein
MKYRELSKETLFRRGYCNCYNNLCEQGESMRRIIAASKRDTSTI